MEITLFKGATSGDHSKSKYGEAVTIDSLKELHDIVVNEAYSLAIFEDNTRSINNFIETSFIGMDFDGGTTLELIKERVNQLGYMCSISLTKSHQIPKHGIVEDRFRVILQLSSTINNKDDYDATWQFLNKLFPEMDQACKNCDRYFSPSKESHIYTNGRTVDIVKASPKLKKSDKVASIDGTSIPPKIVLEKEVTYFLQNAPTGLNGEFNASLNKAAFMLARGGMPKYLSLVLLKEVSPDDFDKNDLTTFNSGYESGLNKGPLGSTSPKEKLSEEDIFEILLSSFKDKFYIVEDDKGRRGLILENLGNKIVKAISSERLSNEIGNTIRRETGKFTDATKTKKHMENWLQYSNPIKEEIATITLKEDNALTYNRLPFNIREGNHPIFTEFLNRTTNADSLCAFIWSLFVKDSDQQQYVWLYGKGGNGKSSLGIFLEKCLGSAYMAKNAVNSYGNKNFTASLIGKRLAVFDDNNSTTFVQSGTFKEITGGGAIEVEEKYEKSYCIHLQTKFLFFSNFAPEISDKEADLRRLILCHVGPISGEFDCEYNDKLWAERSAILYSCKKAYEKLAQSGTIETEKKEARIIARNHNLACDEVYDMWLQEGDEISAKNLYKLCRGPARIHNIKYNTFLAYILNLPNVYVTVKEGQTYYKGIQKQ